MRFLALLAWAGMLFGADDIRLLVLDLDSGQAIAGAQVTVGGRDFLSDEQGEVLLSGWRRGSHSLRLQKAGYVDPMDVGGEGRVYELSSTAVLGLSRGVAIAGQVTNSEGTPLSGLSVTALRKGYLDSIGASAMTDDLGRYRLHGLPAGSYTVAALPAPENSETPGVTYYPATGNVSGAVFLETVSGQVLNSIDIVVNGRTTGALALTVVGIPKEWAGKLPMVALLPRVGLRVPIAAKFTDAEGKAVFENIPFGNYWLAAWGPAAEPHARYDLLPVSIGDANPIPARLELRPPRTLAGRFVSGAAACAGLESLQLRSEAGWPELWRLRVANESGSFVVEGLPPGQMHFSIPDLDPACHVKATEMSQNATIWLAASDGEISGKAAADARLVLLSGRSQETTSGKSGQFRFDRLAPGDYRLFHSGKVSRIYLLPGQRLTLDLTQ